MLPSRSIGPRKQFARSMIPACSLLALICGGCSSTQPASQPNWYATDRPYWVSARPQSQATPAPIPAQKAEVEDDGREAQLPPPRRIRQEPDDPSEPYSRNYGTRPPVRKADVSTRPSAPAPIPDDLPPAFRKRLADADGEARE